jgi:glycosyltransferase involved in cell wall biosynthesis
MIRSVTHISTVHPAFDTRIFYKECTSLVKNGYKVNLVVTHHKEETIDKIHIIPLPSIENRWVRGIFKPWMALIKALKTKASIYHFHDPELIPVGIVLKLLGKKIIYDVHEDVPNDILHKYWIPKLLRAPISFFMKSLQILGAKVFDGIITATPHINQIFQKYGAETVNINNYPSFHHNDELFLDHKEPNSICYIGCITKERGIIELVKALEGTSIKLYLAGKFDTHLLEQEVRSLPGWKNVQYMGYLERENIKLIYEKSLIGICLFHKIPNHEYCLPNKIFEYWSWGLPIIASDIAYWKSCFSTPEIIEFVNLKSVSQLRNKLLMMLSNDIQLKEAGFLSRQLVLKNYNWDSEADKLIYFYKTILNLRK